MDARLKKGEEYVINLAVYLNFPSGLVMVGMAAKGLDQQLKAKKYLCFWNLPSCLLKHPLTYFPPKSACSQHKPLTFPITQLAAMSKNDLKEGCKYKQQVLRKVLQEERTGDEEAALHIISRSGNRATFQKGKSAGVEALEKQRSQVGMYGL